MKSWRIVIPAAVAVCFGGVIGFNVWKAKLTEEYLAGMKPEPSPVSVMKVEKRNWQDMISAIGFVEPNQGVEVTAEAQGSITGLYFESGDVVQENQVLVQINDSVEKANYDLAQAKTVAAEKKYRRYETLIKQGNVSQQDLDNAKADYEACRAEVNGISAQMDKLKIRAPFTGKLGIRNIYAGQYVQPGTKIVHLEDNSLVRVRFTVSQNDVERIKIGQEVVVTVDSWPGQEFRGEVSAIEVVMNYQSGILQVQATIPNPANKLITGMYAKVNVLLPEIPDQIAVPDTAVAYNLYGSSVYVVSEDASTGEKTVKETFIKTGEQAGDLVRVTSGLKEGDLVVTEGQVRLSNGSPIVFQDDYKLTRSEELPNL